MNINARKLALRILDEMDYSKEFSHLVLNRTFQKYEVDSSDRRFITSLVLGVLENRIRLDYYIRKLSEQRFTRIHHSIINILRLGLYQLEFLDKVPESAAVNESVKLAKSISERDAKFVNGILRNFIRSGKTIALPDKKRHLITYLSVKHSFPEWLIELWLSAYGRSFTEALLDVSNQTPKLSLRVNLEKSTPEAVIKAFEEVGVTARISSLVPIGIVIDDMNHLGLSQLPGFSEGYFQIQDVSSMCVGYYSGAKLGDKVLDVCAAPGGKATHLAQLVGNTGQVIARDLRPEKLDQIRENAARLGISNMVIESHDAMTLDTTLIDLMDIVLVDAPCSGLGIIRRKPDIKYNRTPEDIEALVKIQKDILEVASNYVKSGGTLIYSTCTLNPSENEEVVKAFLENDHDFERVTVKDEAMMTLFPNIHGTDGFFIAKMIKTDKR